jgi:Ni/Co efflux regulator RcnB
MKRLVLSAVALSMLALPVAQAQAGPRNEAPRYERHDSDWNKRPGFDKHRFDKPRFDKKVIVKKKVVVKRKHWARGNRVPAWQRNYVVRDYHRHGLRRPAYGQQWVKVDNDFLLISLASGIIAGIIAAQ